MVNNIGAFELTDPSIQIYTCSDSILNSGKWVNPYAGPESFCKVDRFVDVDLYGEYSFNEHLRVHGSILNLFDKPPPLDMQTYGSAGNYSNAFHDAGAIGRFCMVGPVLPPGRREVDGASAPVGQSRPPAQQPGFINKKGISMRAWSFAVLAAVVLGLSGCGYNTLQQKDEGVKAAWSEVVNQYQRRADLIPNLVNTVKGYAAQEQRVLVEVTEARAKVGSIQVTPEVLNNPELFQKYQAAQNQLTGALKSLFAVSENYPQLKSDQNFRDLQSQIEGTENRITVARNRYIQAVQDYNVTVRSFPQNLTAKMFGFQVKPNFTVANEQQISTAPTVSFDTSTPGNPASAPPAQPAGPPKTQ